MDSSLPRSQLTRRPRHVGLGAILATVLLSVIACGQTSAHSALPSGQTSAHSGLPRGTLFLGSTRIALHIEIAETEAARQRGLMDRKILAGDAGMVFLFDQPQRPAFYMKDTLIPLSIAFWDRTNRIVSILDMDPCPPTNCPTYSPGVLVVGAVEANQGFFAEHGIEVGDKVELER